MTVDLAALKAKLVVASRIAHMERLVQSVGHLSVRVPGTETFLVPPRRSAGLVTARDVLLMDLAGKVLAGDGEPNSEWTIHSEIYRARPDVGAVAHVHPFYTIVLGSVGERVRPVHNWGATFGAGVGFDDVVGYIRDQERAQQMVRALGSYKAVMLRGHGATVVGATLEEALISSLELEYNAHLQVTCLSIGKPLYFTPEESAPIVGNPPRLWEYYLAKLQGQLDRPLPASDQ